MARLEAEREDLFEEGISLKQRIELRLPELAMTVVAGRRSHGGWSIYFGSDPSYHFDAHGRLRRAFVGSELYRTHGVTLARMRRVRTAAAVELRRTDLDAAACAAFLERTRQFVAQLSELLTSGQAESLRQFPQEGDLRPMLADAVQQILAGGPALAPPILMRRPGLRVAENEGGPAAPRQPDC